MKRRPELTEEELIDWWLGKYHNTSLKEVLEKYPEECKSPAWYKLFAVTQQQHDEWYEWAIREIASRKGLSLKYVRRWWGFTYLNTSPSVKDEQHATT